MSFDTVLDNPMSGIAAEAPVSNNQSASLRYAVDQSINNYFDKLDGHAPANVYKMVLEEMEVPLLNAVMRFVRGNQCKAAIILGISRGTLRKKLKQYGML